MTNVLLVPIKLNAFYSDGSAKLAAPAADFTRLPYQWVDPLRADAREPTQPGAASLRQPPPTPHIAGVNGDHPFLGDTVFRTPSPSFSGMDDTWTPPAGLHLHWALPDALTVQRVDPRSGGKPRFPQVPNRWLIVLKTKVGSRWAQKGCWLVESDYLHACPKMVARPCGSSAISFPIAPPEAFRKILEAPVPPTRNPTADDIAQNPFFYQAPFRCMGRQVDFEAWQKGTTKQEYLTDHNRLGLTAIGYGDPLFASIYSNCFSVFGFNDDLSIGGYPRRYDLLGWYDDPSRDCLSFFHDLPAHRNPWHALKSEYEWTGKDDTAGFPALSLYYSRLEIDTALDGSLPKPHATLSVGNTATEALSAYLSSQLESDHERQSVVEEQLEAIDLLPKIGGETVDLGAKFREARHDKGFKKVHGGSLWTVRARRTKSAAKAPAHDEADAVALPGGLDRILDRINRLQTAYDNSWNHIDSLRRRAFADWFRLEHERITQPGLDPQLPDINDILSYAQSSALTPLQNRIAATGEITYERHASGNVVATVRDDGSRQDVTIQYSLAHALVSALNDLAGQLATWNAGKAAQNASLDYYMVRKGGPRFYQPSEPVVLLEGDAVVATERHGTDGSLDCTLLAVAGAEDGLTQSLRNHGIASGPFDRILKTIEAFSQTGGAGFTKQDKQPWNPVALQWKAQVWPEKRKTHIGPSGEGIGYDPDYIAGTYALDVDAPDLKIKTRPSALKNAEAPYDYTGRAILVSHAPASVQNAIGDYLLSLTLADLKHGGLRNQTVDNDIDHKYDRALLGWAKAVFDIQDPPFLAQLKDPSTLTPQQTAEQQNQLATWMAKQYPFKTKADGKSQLLNLADWTKQHLDWCDTRPVILDDKKRRHSVGKNPDMFANDPVRTAIRAYVQLIGKSLLSQALSGFNDALLTQQRAFQLPVWDWRAVPLDDQRRFARGLTQSLGGAHVGPIFDGTFLPFRSGLMIVPALTVIDSFGQYLELAHGGPAATQKSDRMTLQDNAAASTASPSTIATPAENRHWIYLPPRLSQESRLNFRWLSASGGAAGEDEWEVNDHPASTPVCGWVLPNHLNYSLAVYDAGGTPLGSLVQSWPDKHFALTWEPAPSTNNSLPSSKISNFHLRTFVSNIMTWASQKGGQERWTEFLKSINRALRDIDPKSFAQHPALSLLIGRPMALVRASLELQVKGMPAEDTTVEAFKDDLKHKRFARLTNGFDDVVVPVRLGEARQLNDGLVAYWVENGEGGYRCGQNGPVHFPQLSNHGSLADTIGVTVSGDPLMFTMLVDPRASVHATCGILPVKEISIPPDHYAKVLRTLSVTFLTSPVLTPKDAVELPLPAEAGYGWSWLDRPTGFTWNRVADIKAASRDARYESQRILEGWLKLTPQAEKDTS